MSSYRRFWLATIVAPLSAPVLFLLTLVAISDSVPQTLPRVMTLAALGISYLGLIFIGLPTIYFLKATGRFNAVTMLSAGAFGGATWIFVLMLINRYRTESVYSIHTSEIVFGAVCGLVVASTFMLIGGRQSSLPGVRDTQQ